MEIEGLRNCRLCELHKTRSHVLLGEGDPNAQIMFIAQAPGELEDKENKMFIGPSGKILDMLFLASGFSRKDVYLTNLIKCRLPKNRRPRQREIIACSVYLEQEIMIVNPDILVPLGYYATKYLFAKYELSPFAKKEYPEKIGISYQIKNRIIFPLSHPASLLYHDEFTAGNIDNCRKLRNLLILPDDLEVYQL
ncbi:MAG: uracil-DNA glycosylase [Candidatus Aminicenantes bacterium]|nr:uracil-DNA glycosylase [Candidatus Aminicenantes bacterium]